MRLDAARTSHDCNGAAIDLRQEEGRDRRVVHGHISFRDSFLFEHETVGMRYFHAMQDQFVASACLALHGSPFIVGWLLWRLLCRKKAFIADKGLVFTMSSSTRPPF